MNNTYHNFNKSLFTPIRSIPQAQLLTAELLENAFKEFGVTVLDTQMNEKGDKLGIVIVEAGKKIDLPVIEAVAKTYPNETLEAQKRTSKDLPIGMPIAILDMSQTSSVAIWDLLYNLNTAKLISDLNIAGYEICLFGQNPISKILRLSTENTISRRREPYIKLTINELIISIGNPEARNKLIENLKPFVAEAKMRNLNPNRLGSNGKILININNQEKKQLHIALFNLIILLNSKEINNTEN